MKGNQCGKSGGGKEGKYSLPCETPSKMNLRRALPQVLATSAKNLILLGYGMTLGFPTIVIPSLMSDDEAENSTNSSAMTSSETLTLNIDQISWFSSINLLCVPIGCALSGVCTQPLGRKKSMLILNLPLLAAWVIYSYANSVGMLYLALVITGLTGGLLEAPVLTYVAEITEPELRGILSATSSACVILGIFLQFLMGTWFSWRTVAIINMVVPVTAVVALLFVPESPHWLVGENRLEDARKSLQWLRGWVQPADVDKELASLKNNVPLRKPDQFTVQENHHGNKDTWRKFVSSSGIEKYCQRTFLHPFAIVTFVFAIQHLGGITPLQTYAVSIFQELGSPINKYLSTVLLGLVQLLGALCCLTFISFTGKKPLAILSSISAGLLMMAVAVNAALSSSSSPLEVHSSWVPLIGLVGCAFTSHICLRLLPWILIGEVFPPQVRATASGLSGGTGYIIGFIANKSYLYLVKAFQLWGTLLFYSMINLVGAVVIIKYLPETEGLTLLEIEDYFKDKKEKARNDSKNENMGVSNPALEPESYI